MGLGSLIDSVVGAFSPEAGVRRRQARAVLAALAAHEGAEQNRTTGDWGTEQYSPDQAVLPELDNLTARARSAVRNDWVGKSARRAWRRHTVGDGITPQARARDEKGALREEFNAKRDALWARWSRSPAAVDVEGRKSLAEFVALIHDEWRTTGNGFAVWSYTRTADEVGLRLQSFELEQLAQDFTEGMQPAAGNEIRRGIEIDRVGKPAAFWVHLAKHPMEGVTYPGYRHRFDDTKPVRIPAERVLWLNRQSRPRETLAAGEFTPVLAKMHQQKRYDDAEQVAKGMESFLAFAIKQNPEYGKALGFGSAAPGAGLTGSSATAASDAGQSRKMRLEKGTMPVLFPGEEIQMFNPRRPGQQYASYTAAQVAMIAAGLGLNYSTLMRRFEGSYSSERMGLIELWLEIDADQMLVIDQILRPLWRLHGLLAITEGRLSAPGFFGSFEAAEGYHEAIWQPPPRRWTDPAKEAAGAWIRRRLMLDTLGTQLNTEGRDWRETLREVAEIKGAAKKLGIDMPEFEGADSQTNSSSPKTHGTGDAAEMTTRTLDDVVGVILKAAQEESGEEMRRSAAGVDDRGAVEQ